MMQYTTPDDIPMSIGMSCGYLHKVHSHRKDSFLVDVYLAQETQSKKNNLSLTCHVPGSHTTVCRWAVASRNSLSGRAGGHWRSRCFKR